MKKKIIIASFIALPIMFLLTDYLLFITTSYKLISTPSYCISRYRLMSLLSTGSSYNNQIGANMSSDRFAKNVYGCAALKYEGYKLPADKKILEDYEFKPKIENTHVLKELRFEGAEYFSEVFGDCSTVNKCLVARFHVRQIIKNGYADSYYYDVILTKDAAGKLRTTRESFSPSGEKG
jgi:hypothetical protein